MSTNSLITDEMRAAVGRELGRTTSYPVAASDIRRWALAVYHPEPPPRRFWDGGPDGDVVAPEEFNPFAWMTADPPGPPVHGSWGPTIEARLGLPEVQLAHMLNGGVETTYGTLMRPGDVITSTTTLDDYRERTGRLGPMLITRTRSVWRTAGDDHVKTTVNTLIRYGTA